jgi:hypothetical protein
VLCTGAIDLLMAVLFLAAHQRTATPSLRSTAAPMS